jgi:hypothetical protein
MRVIYNTCFADPWLKVAEILEKKHAFAPVYWIGYEIDDSASRVPVAFPNAIYQSIFDAWKGIFPDSISRHYCQSHIPIDFLRDIAGYELQALKMMDRMDLDGHSFSFSERQRHFRNFLRNWLSCIQTLRPELVISATFPHRVYDYALYLLCRQMRIPFLMFQHSAFPGRIIPERDIYSIGSEIKNDYENILRTTSDWNSLQAKLAPDIREHYQNVQKDYALGKPGYMETNELQHKQSSNALGLARKFITDVIHHPAKYFGGKGYLIQGFPTCWKQKKKSIEASRLGIIKYSAKKNATNRAKKTLRRYYDRRTRTPDFLDPYVFLPLHYQPEMTSNPTGDIFVDQFLCAETLVKHLPHDWKIYVKEHPAQYQSHGEGQTSRIKEFYDDLLKYPNVILVPFAIDSFHLLANAKAVATISGTVGWEAMVRRKPVLVFGTSWYENYPGALKINNEESAGKICEFIQNFAFDEHKLLAYLAALEKNSLRAYYFRGLKDKMRQPEAECVANLVTSIIRSVNEP